MQKFLALLAGVLFASSASAQTLTAVCRDPVGRLYGQHGNLKHGQAVDESDSMKGGLVTIIWDTKAPEAQIITQGSGGGTPLADKGLRVHASEEQLSFLVTYPAAVWLYSLFPQPGLLLITQHVNGLAIDSGGALSKTMKAKCEISTKQG